MTPYEKKIAALVDAFERERDETLENSREFQRLATLTREECQVLAHAAIRAISAAGFIVTTIENTDLT